MDLQAQIDHTRNVAIFSRNHLDYLKDAAAEAPDKPITFRASTVWKSGQKAIDAHGPRKIYFVPVGGGELVE